MAVPFFPTSCAVRWFKSNAPEFASLREMLFGRELQSVVTLADKEPGLSGNRGRASNGLALGVRKQGSYE